MCAANLGYGLHVKITDRNYILVKKHCISLINAIYLVKKNMSSLLVAWLMMKHHHL
jgi:hypothetical protein